MFWTIISISFTAVMTATRLLPERYKRTAVSVGIIALVCSVSAQLASAIVARQREALADEKRDKAEKITQRANEDLASLKATLALVQYTVGDLGKLNDISGGAKYYCRVAADTKKENLNVYLQRINNQFKGADASGLVGIRDPRPGSHIYELVFGQHLELAAAEVFHRLAMSHKLPPSNQVAAILAE
ncbi:MAG: hypothetical protein ABSB78_14340 [Bacteroidota bacterium]